MIRRPLVRMLFASAATAVAIALAGCDSETLTRSNLRANQPLSPKILADIEQKNMVKETPMLIRLFKEEAELEVWKQTREGRYALLKTYPICRWSGELGPKVKEGDRQAPEGFYTVTPGQMNPNSSYYLAFNMGYPNAYDRAYGRTGSELMVHGDCSSRGCYAMTDEQMGEIYALARESFFGGQKAFQVQAFPFRMTPVNLARHRANPNMRFWRMLKEGYDHFEVTRLEPKVNICEKRYVFDAEASSDSTTPLSFNAAGKCPAYEVPADIVAAVREKQQRDEIRTAELINHTPVAPIKTGTDGGMNPVYQAALNVQHPDASGQEGVAVHALAATTAHGTVPRHINPPRVSRPVYTSVQATPGETSGGFFGRLTRAMGGQETASEEPKSLAGRPRPVETAAHRMGRAWPGVRVRLRPLRIGWLRELPGHRSHPLRLFRLRLRPSRPRWRHSVRSPPVRHCAAPAPRRRRPCRRLRHARPHHRAPSRPGRRHR
ncbi:MAG: hypothetical protein GEU91_02965 [Rhizobiales bacterium]|nr:hypothetical protein [Hyphomicrobiales bacterium]